MRVMLDDWQFNAGVLGFYNIAQYYKLNIAKKDNYIEFDKEVLDGFEDKYFEYIGEKNKQDIPYYKLLDNIGSAVLYLKEFIEFENNEKLSLANELISKKIEPKTKSKSYTAAYGLAGMVLKYNELKNYIKAIKVDKKKSLEDIKELAKEKISALRELRAFFDIPILKKYIIAQDVRFCIIGRFWDGKSFMNQKATADVFEFFRKDFINPVLEYRPDNEGSYQCATCSTPIKMKGDMFQSFCWLVNTGVDDKKKSSHYWNYDPSFLVICPICTLMYACIPAGFNLRYGEGIFINNNTSINTLSRANLVTDDIKTISDIEEVSYFKIAEDLNLNNERKARTNDEADIQVIKFKSVEGKRGKNRVDSFNLLSREKLNIVARNHNLLKYITGTYVEINPKAKMSIYNKVVDSIYNNQNLYWLIFYVVKEGIKNDKDFSFITDVLLKINANIVKREVAQIMAHIDDIKEFKVYGKNLRRKYIQYKAEKKIEVMQYRFTNALKVKNKNLFMENLLRAYMYISEPVPENIEKVLYNEENLQSLGYAFVAGLSCVDDKENQNGKNNQNVESEVEGV